MRGGMHGHEAGRFHFSDRSYKLMLMTGEAFDAPCRSPFMATARQPAQGSAVRMNPDLRWEGLFLERSGIQQNCVGATIP